MDDEDETEVWIEEMRGADVAAELPLAPNVEAFKAMLEDKAQLGRLKFLMRHGFDADGKLINPIAMGGRSVSIFDMSGGRARY